MQYYALLSLTLLSLQASSAEDSSIASEAEVIDESAHVSAPIAGPFCNLF